MSEAFNEWWRKEGQFGRAGGGDYEESFAFNAWNAALAAAPVGADRKAMAGEVDRLANNLANYLWNRTLQNHDQAPRMRVQLREAIDRLASLPVGAQEPVARTSERHFALREGHQIASEDAYFEAREPADSPEHRLYFRAGFTRGFDAAEQAYPAAPQSVEPTQPAKAVLPPIERDEQMQREYIPLPGGWELQTKGNGSTLRLCDTKTGERHPLLVGPEWVSQFVERMGREIHAAVLKQAGGAR
jgi:hypothetical protein